MARFEKERNIIKFYLGEDESKCYKFDINTGILYGIKGSPIKRTPAGMNNFMECHRNDNVVLSFLCFIHNYRSIAYASMSACAKYIQICDKLDSIGYRNLSWSYSTEKLDFINEHFKDFVKYRKNNANGSLEDFFSDYSLDIWLKEHHLKIDEHFTREMARTLKNNCRQDCSEERISCSAFYLRKGILKVLNAYTAFSVLFNYFDYCDKLETKYVKGDLLKEYVIVKETYELRKTEIDNKYLEQYQMARKDILFFENEEYITIIPTTTKEFIDEAESQSNCVARSYLPMVLRNETNIVFIRKKNNVKKSYITCEVRNGRIIQYLTRFNNRPTDESDIEFRRQYQDFLDSCREVWELNKYSHSI